MTTNLKTVLSFSTLALLVITIANVSSVAAGGRWQGPLPDSIGLPPPAMCASRGAAGTAYVSGVNCRVMWVDGYPRTYIVYIPPAGVRDPAPVVFMFHGSSGTGAKHFRISGWQETADQEGLIAVFPTGLTYCKLNFPCGNGGRAGWTTKWHDYLLSVDPEINLAVQPPNYPSGAPWPADDVQFTRQMLNDLNDPATGLQVDPARIYASGFSNGASFTARLAVELSDQLAAVGYVAGGLLPDTGHPPPVANIPIYAAFGTTDPKILATINSQRGLAALPLDPAELFDIPEISQGFITPHLDGFDHTYNPDTFVPYLSYRTNTYTLLRWRTASNEGAPHIFRLAVLGGLAHIYPNGCPSGPKPNNPACFKAAHQFWRFFEQHPKSDSTTSSLDAESFSIETDSQP